MNDLSCLLITCNRPEYLLRSVSYYSQTQLQIDIYDGSQDNYESLISPFLGERIRYHHFPNAGSIQRARVALAQVNTEFVKILADDDYSLIDGLGSCLSYLRHNPDYIACFGLILAYTESIQKIQYHLSEQHNFNFQLDQDDSSSRVAQFWSQCSYGLQHAIFRTEHYKKCLECTYYGLEGSGNYDYNLRERVLLTAIAALGKCRFLHIPFMVRESRKNTEGSNSRDLHQIVADSNNKDHYHLFLIKLELIASICNELNPYHFAKQVSNYIIDWEMNLRRLVWNHPLLFTSTWSIFSDKPALFFEPKQYIEYGFYTPDFFDLLYDLDFRTRSFALCSSNPLHANFNWQNDHNQLIEILREQPFHIYALQSLQKQLLKYPDQSIQINLDNWLDRIYSTGIQQLTNK